ncbi:MDR family MFS transporter [Rossellomorea sp. KS-H15a]|uniref:MDR family MFS transporter n=1 Tax=Rossellomorea sp. KS-H15a TaxID=2963940 RepID=UPI0020C66E1F|nr:MDR family MFS transporter [Rossellomorea sp. KS-H15a]UTE76783.1 DHA2 family efflux MFS transporter permease subunit [Rossellomorea sp. KS-H15a]
MSELNRKELRFGPMFTVMLLGAFMGILNETLLSTALPSIMNDFGLNENKVQWLTTAFLLTNGVMIPVSAYLTERFSTRALFLSAIGLFGLGTIVAALSQSFSMLLLGRVVQAAGSGIMLPLIMTIILTIVPKDRRGRMMGWAGIVISFGPAIGPTLSGLLLEYFSWRALFLIVVPIVAVVMMLAMIYVKNVTKLTRPKIDILSIVLSSLGFGGLLYGFSIAGEKGWSSPSVLLFILFGFLTLGVFIWRQLRLEQPLLQFRVFRYKRFTLSLVITMVVIVSMIGAETLLPLYMQNVRGFSPLQSGLMLLPGAIVMGIMSPVTGILFDRWGAKKLAVPGLLIVVVTSFLMTNLSMETSIIYLSSVYCLRMFGLSLAMMPVMTSGLNQIPVQWSAHGSALANTFQQVSGSIGTAILITVMTMSSQSYTDVQGKGTNGLGELAMIHGYNQAFLFATILAIGALVLSLFLNRETADQTEKNVSEAY